MDEVLKGQSGKVIGKGIAVKISGVNYSWEVNQFLLIKKLNMLMYEFRNVCERTQLKIIVVKSRKLM